jgi:hypothetical protein
VLSGAERNWVSWLSDALSVQDSIDSTLLIEDLKGAGRMPSLSSSAGAATYRQKRTLETLRYGADSVEKPFQ